MAPREGDVKAKIGAEGAPPSAARAWGNCDIKDCRRGSKIYFPVYVPGAGSRWGSAFSSQGDGEITFAARSKWPVAASQGRHHQGRRRPKYASRNPVFKPSPITPNYKDYLIFEASRSTKRQAALSRRAYRLPARPA